MDGLDQAADAPRWAGEELTSCSCGRPSTHVRLGATHTRGATTAVRLTVVPHCGHDHPDRLEQPADPQSAAVRADLWPTAAVPGTPTRWSDLSTAAFLISLTTTWLPLPLLLVDLASLAVFANRSWTSLSGLTSEESMGAGWQVALDEASRKTIVDGVQSPACRPCEVNVRHPSSPDLQPVWLFMAAVSGFDGRELGKVLWGPVPDAASLEPSHQSSDHVGLDQVGHTAEEFIVRLQVALDEHRDAPTTLAALVVEIHSVPARSSAAPMLDERPDERLGLALLDNIELLVEPSQTIGRLGRQMVGIVCPEVSTYREVIDLAERLVGLAEPCSALSRRGRRALGDRRCRLPPPAGRRCRDLAPTCGRGVGGGPGAGPERVRGGHRNRAREQRRHRAIP